MEFIYLLYLIISALTLHIFQGWMWHNTRKFGIATWQIVANISTLANYAATIYLVAYTIKTLAK